MTLLSQAAKGLNLTPGQRAFLKMLVALIINALSLGVTAALSLVVLALNSQQSIDLASLARMCAIAIASSFLSVVGHGVAKYISAHGDAPLGAVVDTTITTASARLAAVSAPRSIAPVVRTQTPESASTSSVVSVSGDATTTAPHIPIIQS